MKVILVFCTIFMLENCVSVGYSQGFGPSGSIYSDYTIGISGNRGTKGPKFAEGCVYKISVLFTLGDAGIQEIASESGIKKIYTVDRRGFGIINNYIFHKLCTVITGE